MPRCAAAPLGREEGAQAVPWPGSLSLRADVAEGMASDARVAAMTAASPEATRAARDDLQLLPAPSAQTSTRFSLGGARSDAVTADGTRGGFLATLESNHTHIEDKKETQDIAKGKAPPSLDELG